MPLTARLAKTVLTSRAGNLIARPWLDQFVLYSLKHWIFPLSRLWAAARAAEGNVDRFITQVPLKKAGPRQREIIKKALNEFEHTRLKSFSMEKLWQDYFFGAEPVAPERLPIVEEMRLDFKSAYNMSRNSFRPLRKLVKTSVLMNPPTPNDVASRFGHSGERLDTLFKPPSHFPAVELSRSVPTSYGNDYWIRFPSPCPEIGDEVYARVYEPDNVINPPTLIFGHGICVEFDHYHQLLDEITQLTRHGIRVIRPEAPWHGRRVLPGHYGGEQFLSKIPLSMFDFINAQHQEWATIIHWCRENFCAPVGIGGSSLGAQTAKTIAMNASNWPSDLQPDALFIVTHSRHMAEAALDGVLSDIWNLGESLRSVGWTQELEKSWLEKIDPPKTPCMSGESIVTVYGEKDTVTPIASAIAQMNDWEVPEKNRFRYRRGHFSIPLGMIYDDTPIKRIAQVLKGLIINFSAKQSPENLAEHTIN
ncbi:MAG: hypothetical protein ACRBBN_17580 [Methyloligellaceae bacterium]